MDCQGEGVHKLRTQVSMEEKRLNLSRTSGEERELSLTSSMLGGGGKQNNPLFKPCALCT